MAVVYAGEVENLLVMADERWGEVGRAYVVPVAGRSITADAILAQYSKPPTSIAMQTKAGCILYFVVGIALLAIPRFPPWALVLLLALAGAWLPR